MKRFLSLLIIICFIPAFCGCGSIYANYREIQQLMVVQTMGIDREKGGIQVSLAAAAEAAGSEPRRMTAQGATITDAIDRAYKLSYEEEIFFSHVNHLLVGEAAAEEGLVAFLDYVCQSPAMRIDIPLYIVRGSTANQAVMEVGDSNKGISEVMQTVHESFASPGNSRVFTVADTINSVMAVHWSARWNVYRLPSRSVRGRMKPPRGTAVRKSSKTTTRVMDRTQGWRIIRDRSRVNVR